MVILPEFSYLNSLLTYMQEGKPLPFHEAYVGGSRSCGKTVNWGSFVPKACNLVKSDLSGFVKVGGYIYRNERLDLLDTWDDYNKFIDTEILEQGFQKKESRLRWKFDNGNEVVFDYVKRKTKGKTYGKGKSQIIGDYIIVIIEEATELEQRKIKDIYNAIRGLNPKAEILFVYIFNPENPGNWLIQKCMRYLPFDEEIMYKTGHMHKIVNIVGLSDQPENILIHYVNWRAIQKHIEVPAPQTKLGKRYVALDPIVVPQYKLDGIVKAYELDELGAKIDDIGCPGASVDNLFLRYMDSIPEPLYYKHGYLVGGGDTGFGQTGGSGYTAFHLVAYDKSGQADVYATYKWDQKIQWKNNILILQDIVEFYIREITDYCEKTGDFVNAEFPVIVKVDNSAQTDISVLNEIAKSRGVGDSIKFVASVKIPRWDRFRMLIYQLAKKYLRINHYKCKPLIDEMYSISVDPDSKTFKTIGADHCIDALCYAFGLMIYNFIDNEDKETFRTVLSKSAKKYV